MKRHGFIKNKVMPQPVGASVDKANRFSHSNVISPTFEGDDGDDVWQVQSQHHPNVTYKIHAHVTEYASCTCECTLRGNFCKHQIIILLMCANLTMKNIIEYCNTYYGTHCGGLKCMFVNLTYLQLDDGVSNDEDCNQDPIDEVGIVGIGRFSTMDEDNCFDNVDVPKGSFTPMDRGLIHLHETMVEIIMECTMGANVELCDHATSLFRGVGSIIHHFCWVPINESMHLGMAFRGWMMVSGTPSIG
jgi:hypothetical protein